MRLGLRSSAALACGLLAAAPDAAAPIELEPGDIVAVDPRLNRLLRIDPVTGERQEIATVPVSDGVSVAIDSEGQALVGAYGQVLRIDPASGASSVVSEGGWLQHVFAIALDADGQILVPAGTLVGSIVRIDPVTGEQTLVSTGGDLQCPAGIGLLPDGDLLVVDGGRGGAGPGLVLRIDPETGEQERIASPPLPGVPWAGLTTLEGEAFYATLMPGELVRVDVDTGERQLIAATGDTFSLARENAGTFLVATFLEPPNLEDTTIRRIDPATGAGHVLASFDGFVSGLAVVPDPAAALAMLEEPVEPDLDHDRRADPEDNCIERWNPDQGDADEDGFGDLCDGDFDGDGRVGTRDWATLGRAFGARAGSARYARAVDMNGDGAIGAADFLLWLRGFARPPGPSGLAPSADGAPNGDGV